MQPTSAMFAVLGLVVVAALIGVWYQRAADRRRRTPETSASAEQLGLTRLGAAATLVQFSTAFCAQCPGMRRALTRLASAHDGVEFYEIDLTAHPDLAEEYRVMQTPTVMVLDHAENLIARYHGPTSQGIIEADIFELEGRKR